MAAWRTSLAEILLVAKQLNATVVEPCIKNGYLRACDDYAVRLNQVYDVGELRKFYPNIVSYEVYKAMLAVKNPVIVPMCFQNPQKPSDVARSCANWTNMYNKDVTPLLATARQQNNGTTVLHINYYRPGGFRGTIVGGKLLQDYLNKTGFILAKHFAFERQHYDIVDYLLQLMGISNTSDFDVIHWRAERPNIDFDDCATKILQARKAMGNSTTVLMSSINQHNDMQWYKLDKSNQSDAVRSVDRLLDSGFHKLDQVLDKVRHIIPDKIVLPVWDQIIAQKAQRFATCIKGCAQTNDPCVACNWPGRFPQVTVDLRTLIGKSSYECWPT
ncbi:hypothetical protein MHU86_5003 [Fragilaria crotonensis]|nr:hypothetical protein MHU86_5003 [Fragilaria crotonensis]